MTHLERGKLIARAELLAAQTMAGTKILEQDPFLVTISATGKSFAIINFFSNDGIPPEFFLFINALIQRTEQERAAIWRKLNSDTGNRI